MVARYAYWNSVVRGTSAAGLPAVRIEGEGNVVIQNIAQVVQPVSKESVLKGLSNGPYRLPSGEL